MSENIYETTLKQWNSKKMFEIHLLYSIVYNKVDVTKVVCYARKQRSCRLSIWICARSPWRFVLTHFFAALAQFWNNLFRHLVSKQITGVASTSSFLKKFNAFAPFRIMESFNFNSPSFLTPLKVSKPLFFHEFFSNLVSATFLVKSKLSTSKQYKTVVFSRFFCTEWFDTLKLKFSFVFRLWMSMECF